MGNHLNQWRSSTLALTCVSGLGRRFKRYVRNYTYQSGIFVQVLGKRIADKYMLCIFLFWCKKLQQAILCHNRRGSCDFYLNIANLEEYSAGKINWSGSNILMHHAWTYIISSLLLKRDMHNLSSHCFLALHHDANSQCACNIIRVAGSILYRYDKEKNPAYYWVNAV